MLNKDLIILVDDIIFYILNNIYEPNVYMNCLRLCKYVYSYLMKTHEEKIKIFDLGIIGLYKRYPNLKWKTQNFQYGKSLKIKHILFYPELFSDTIQLAHNFFNREQIIKGETIYGTHEKYLNIKYNDYLSLDTINNIISDNLNCPLFHLFVQIDVFSNPNITFEDKILVPTSHINNYLNNKTILELAKIKKFTHAREHISKNPNVTLKIILDNMNFGWKWDHLSSNRAFTICEILSHSHLPWTNGVNFNPNLTVEEYFKYKDTSLFSNMYGAILSFPTMLIKEKDFVNYPQILNKYYTDYMSSNPSVTIEMLLSVGVSINYNTFSSNKNVTISQILANINEGWNWEYLSLTLTK